jgi:hypothetical protein
MRCYPIFEGMFANLFISQLRVKVDLSQGVRRVHLHIRMLIYLHISPKHELG